MADGDGETKCGQCKYIVFDSQKAVQCDGNCNFWFHTTCARVSDGEYRDLSRNRSRKWYCQGCTLGVTDAGCGYRKDVATVDKIIKKLKTLEPRSEMKSMSVGSQEIGVSRELTKGMNSRLPLPNLQCKKLEWNSIQPFSSLQRKRLVSSKARSKRWREKIKTNNDAWLAFREREAIRKKISKYRKQVGDKVVWKCPMCCHRSFYNHYALMHHLERMLSRVVCSGCAKKVGSVQDLLNHMETECVAIHGTAVPTHPKDVDPAKDETTNSKAVQVGTEDIKLFSSMCDSTAGKGPVISCNDGCKEVASHDCMPACSQSVSDTGKGKNKHFVGPVEQKKVQSYFNCNVCHTTFRSVERHVKLYHSEQEVLVRRLDSTEVYSPESVQKQKLLGESVSKVAFRSHTCNSSVQQGSVENNVSFSHAKMEAEENEVVMKSDVDRLSSSCSSNVLTEKCQLNYDLLNGLGNESGRKREKKTLKLILTRLSGDELKKYLKPPCEESGQKEYEEGTDGTSRISISNTSSAVSRKLKHKDLSNNMGKKKRKSIVKTVAGKVSEIGEREDIMVVKKPNRLLSTQTTQHLESGVTLLGSGVDRACSTLHKKMVLDNVAVKCGMLETSRNTEHSVRASDFLDGVLYNCTLVNGNGDQPTTIRKIGVSGSSTSYAHRHIKRNVLYNRKKDSVREFSSVMAQQSAEFRGFDNSEAGNLGFAAGKDVGTIETLLFPLSSCPELLAAVESPGTQETVSSGVVQPSGENLYKGIPSLIYSSFGLPVPEVLCSTSMQLNPNCLLTFRVSNSRIAKEERTKSTKTISNLKRKLATCDCVKNKDGDMIINNVFDERSKCVKSLCVCIKCGLGFMTHVLYSKHICEKNNFVCTCPKSSRNTGKKRNVKSTIIPKHEINRVTNREDDNVCSEAGSWRKLQAVTTSKTLVCSVCRNMFMSDDVLFPDQRTVALKQDNMPQNVDGTIANYTCKICSIATEKRRGRVLVSKADDKLKEAVEIVVVDPNEDCDMGT